MDYLLKDVTITANYHFGKDYTSSVIFEFFVRMHEDIETRLKVCTKDHGFSWENNSTRNKRADMIAFFSVLYPSSFPAAIEWFRGNLPDKPASPMAPFSPR